MGMYGRLGTRENLKNVVTAVKAAGGTKDPKSTPDAVTYNLQGKVAFRALAKGGNTYIIMYNDEFFPKPEIK